MYERRQCECERARTATDVDRVLVAVGTNEGLHTLRQGLGSSVLVRSDLLRGSRETILSHRRQRDVHAWDRLRCDTRARR